jgi:hypothetical protein
VAGERYTEKAVSTLAAFVESNLPTALAAIETEQSLTSGTITRPVDYVSANVPEDGRSPLVEVYATDSRYEDQRNSIAVVECMVALSFAHDADVEGGELMRHRYVTGLLNTVRDDPTLSGGVVACVLGQMEIQASRGDDSQTRFVIEQPIEVWIQDT